MNSASVVPKAIKSSSCIDNGQHPNVNVHGEAITIKDGAFSWSIEEDGSLTLDDVSLSIPEGSLVVILGKVPIQPCLQSHFRKILGDGCFAEILVVARNNPYV